MADLKNIEGIYFVGIGGIGMSALALYFANSGYMIAGYDRCDSPLTKSLAGEGCDITYDDDIKNLASFYRESGTKNNVLVIYTPAIPAENIILSFFRENGYAVHKRAEILGKISLNTDTIAVAGTHGKTTVSTMIAHLFKQSHLDCSAFLGGISKNYNTNLLLGDGPFTVMEADEYDRSFHRLSPLIAVVTSVDADHLDIYGDHETMIEAYNIFCSKVRRGGKLFINKKIEEKIRIPDGIKYYTYGPEPGSDFRPFGINNLQDYYCFNLQTPQGTLRDLHFPLPGTINIENLSAAIAVAMNCGITESEIRKAILLFKGIKRRFDIRINAPELVYIDDYAHHPEEIRACIMSVREYFLGRKITGIFQPHLFSRTRDHAKSFAAILDELDEAILLPVYPAREKPIAGVSSEMILREMKSQNKKLMKMEDIPDKLEVERLDVLVTIGAGDIDTLVVPIEQKLKERLRK